MRGIVGAGGFVGAHHEFDFGGDFGVHRRQGDGIEAAGGGFLESGDRRFRGGAGDQSRGAGGVQDAVGGKIVGVGVAGALAGNDANAAAGGNALRGGLDHGFVHHQRGGGKIFKIKVGVIAASREGGREIVLEVALGEAVVFEEESLLVQTLFVQTLFVHKN